MNTNSINIKVTAEDTASAKLKAVESSINNLESAVSRTAQSSFPSFKSQMEGIAEIGRTVGAVLSGAVAVGLSLVANQALKQAESFQANRIAFDTMLGSATKASKMMKELTTFASQTPFQVDEVVAYSKQLMSMGLVEEEIIPIMTALGNISAGVGKDKLPLLTYALGQVRAQGKLVGNDIRQFTNAGIPLLEELGKTLGKTTAEVKDMSEKGLISYTDVKKALMGMSGEGGKFNNLMTRLMGTWTGVQSNIKDTTDSLFRFIGGIDETGDAIKGGLIDTLAEVGRNLLRFLGDNKDSLQTFATNLSKALGGIVKFFAGIATSIAQGGGMNEWFNELKKQFPELEGFIDTFSSTLSGIITFIKDNQESIKVFVATLLGLVGLATVIGTITALVTAINPLSVAILAIAAGVALFKKAWDEDWGGIRETIQNAVTRIKEIATDLIAKIKNAWETDFAGIRTLVTGFVDAIKKGIEETGKQIEDAKKWWKEFSDDLSAKFKIVQDNIQPVLDSFGMLFDTIGQVGGAFPKVSSGSDSATKSLDTGKESARDYKKELEDFRKTVQNIVDFLIIGAGSVSLKVIGIQEDVARFVGGIKIAWQTLVVFFDNVAYQISKVTLSMYEAANITGLYGSQVDTARAKADELKQKLATDQQALNTTTNDLKNTLSNLSQQKVEINTRLMTIEATNTLSKTVQQINSSSGTIQVRSENNSAMSSVNSSIAQINAKSAVVRIDANTGPLRSAVSSTLQSFGAAGSAIRASIPAFAGGVSNFAGGLALVGEQGPELVSLPRGSNVLPARETATALNKDISVTNNFYDAGFDFDRYISTLTYQLRTL